MQKTKIRIIGAGLAGCEAAYQLAQAGFTIELFEMKPHKRTPAQITDNLCELVCSNSFRSNNPLNAVGLIKEEMRRLGGFIVRCAEVARVPAGDALAVDREIFSNTVESAIKNHPNIRLISEEITHLPDDGTLTIVATGPLTADALAQDIARHIGSERLAFYDAIAPIIDADGVDMEHAYFLSRYGKGDGSDYLNCSMNQAEYDAFIEALLAADQAHEKSFEQLHYFEGCLPIEVMAGRGKETLRYGPFKPVGLDDPKTGRWPYAVLQLRKENIHGTAYNLVGCQTRMTQGAQRHVFGLIPALKNASFLRYGAIHRNTYLDAPNVLDDQMRLKSLQSKTPIFFAGQITGVEGYVESTACGWIVAHLVRDILTGKNPVPPPETTALGGLYRHTRGTWRVDAKDRYVPSNITWAMIPPLPAFGTRKKPSKDEKRGLLVERALADLQRWQDEHQKTHNSFFASPDACAPTVTSHANCL